METEEEAITLVSSGFYTFAVEIISPMSISGVHSVISCCCPRGYHGKCRSKDDPKLGSGL